MRPGIKPKRLFNKRNRAQRRLDKFGTFYTVEMSYDIRFPCEEPEVLPVMTSKTYICEYDLTTKKFKRRLLPEPDQSNTSRVHIYSPSGNPA